MLKPMLTTLVALILYNPCTQVLCGELPLCIKLKETSTIELSVKNLQDSAVLTRLVYAEGISTGYPDDPLVFEAIAWGVMNRVRLAEASQTKRRLYGSGIRGVIFKKGQFNPAVSRQSRFSKEFLCPTLTPSWDLAVKAAEKALKGEGNPFLETPWEKAHNLSLVTGFYYPHSIQARSRLAPWENSRGMRFIGDVTIGGKALSSERVRFYRLTAHPRDLP